MATYQGFNDFVLQLGRGIHQLHAAGHQFKVYLSDDTPDLENDQGKADLTPITEQNGYAAADILNDYTRAANVGSFVGTDYEWTASGGSFGSFRYAAVYNEDATSPADALVCVWDYGSSITINDGEKFKVDFAATIFTLTGPT